MSLRLLVQVQLSILLASIITRLTLQTNVDFVVRGVRMGIVPIQTDATM